jgi:hypothetical protein
LDLTSFYTTFFFQKLVLRCCPPGVIVVNCCIVAALSNVTLLSLRALADITIGPAIGRAWHLSLHRFRSEHGDRDAGCAHEDAGQPLSANLLSMVLRGAKYAL